jgi:hypothetical protein
LIERIGILSQGMKRRVESILGAAPVGFQRRVEIVPDWYY